MRFKVLLNEELNEIEAIRKGNNLRISYDGQTFEARLIHTDDAHFVLEVEELGPDAFISRKRIRAAGFKEGDNRQLWANGRLVKTGQEVKIGDKLILLESMKMILPIQAPHAGIVTGINCVPGQAVQPGVPLVEIEERK